MIDLDALEASIADGEKRNLFVAPLVKDLIAELREARGERAAVVALLREEERLYEKHWWLHVASSLRRLCDIIERGEHRREEER